MNPLFRDSSKKIPLLWMGILFCCGIVFWGGCASKSSQDGLSTLDVSERQTTNYGTSDTNRERDANQGNIDLMKYKTSF